ncbi:unnamed protein product [Tilletia controversa]|nr:unnamed protein product [Tilletia controversa]
MSGRQSPHLGDPSGSSDPIRSASTSSSSAEAPADSITTAHANILSEVGGLRRSIQRLDGRMDTVVDRVDRMETWIPNDGGDTSSDRHLDTGSIADTDRHTITRLDPALTPAAVSSSIHTTRDLPPHLAEHTPLQPSAAHQVVSGGPLFEPATSERAVSEPAASTSRPPRPDKAAARSTTPHAFKPPQVQAYRSLSPKEKMAIQRLSELLGGSVRQLLDGDVALNGLLDDSGTGLTEHQSAPPPPGPVQPIPPVTPPDSPTHPRTLICRQEFIGTFEDQAPAAMHNMRPPPHPPDKDEGTAAARPDSGPEKSVMGGTTTLVSTPPSVSG